MGKKINLLKKYPSSKRNVDRIQGNKKKYQIIARKFNKQFFDGSRLTGYGGYYYNKRFWYNVVGDFIKYYQVKSSFKILDIGCGKGFMLHDFKKQIKKLKIYGIDISKYAIKNSLPKIKKYLKVSNCKNLPFDNNYFDLVISINTIHNLNKRDCGKSLKEISRVSKGKCFITVDAYRNKEEKERMFKWNLTAKTILSDKKWISFFKKNEYKGDYYWFTP